MLSDRRSILIIGGTSGVGLELVRQLHGAGHRPAVLARSGDKLARLQSELPGVSVYTCELSDRVSVERAWERVAAEHPDLSILINNAATQLTPRFLDDDFDFDGMRTDSIRRSSTFRPVSPFFRKPAPPSIAQPKPPCIRCRRVCVISWRARRPPSSKLSCRLSIRR